MAHGPSEPPLRCLGEDANLLCVLFGDHITPAETTEAADWIVGARRGAQGTVGALVPNQYRSLLRVCAPVPSPTDWWSSYRALFDIVSSIGERHTSTPDRAWFAVWEGHGFANATTHIAWRDAPADDEARLLRERERERLRAEDALRNSEIRAALAEIPRFDVPHRTYYLLRAPVTAVTELRHPEPSGEWRNPDLYWPDDRRWFVATDVDFWSLYIGGSDDMVAELAGNVPTPTEIVTLGHRLETEV